MAQKAKLASSNQQQSKVENLSDPCGGSEARFARLSSKGRFALGSTVLAILVIVVYANGVRNGFVWDDNQQIAANPELRPGIPVRTLFSSDVWGFSHGGIPTHNYYRPLQLITYRAIAEMGGFSPAAFHTASLIFAVAATIVAFAVYWKLTGREGISFSAAALFAVHPIHTEAIDWASALPDIGCTLFLLISFLLFVSDGADADDRPKPVLAEPWLRWILSLASFSAALLWKETAAVLPLLIASYSLMRGGSVRFVARLRAAGRVSLPYWGVLAGYLFLRIRLLGHFAVNQRNWALTGSQWGLTGIHLMTGYWCQLLVPVHLNAYHLFSPILSLSDPRLAVSTFFVVGAGVGMILASRTLPLASFAAQWVFITLLPVMDIYAVGRNVFAERYVYLPSVGFCLLASILVFEAFKRIAARFRWVIAASALTLVILLYASETIERNRDWKDNATLFDATLEASPNAPFVQNMVAATRGSGDAGSDSAESHYLKAASLASAEIPPDRLQMATSFEGLAWIYANRAEFDRALDVLRKVREVDPSDPEVDGEEGLILSKAGRWSEAEGYLQRAVTRSQENENVLNALGIISWQYHHLLDQAAGYFLRALAIHTERDDFRASLCNNLGAVYGDQGRYSDAIKQFESAIDIVYDDPQYHTNLATAFAATGRYAEARAQIQAALAIAPGYRPAKILLQTLSQR